MLDTNNHSIHYKMYKSGKSWVFAGLISAGLLLSFGGETAFADTPADSDSATLQTEQVSPEQSVAQPSQDDPTTLPKSDSDSAPAQSPEDNIPTEPKDSQPTNEPSPSDEPDKNIAPQDNEETNPSNLHKNNYSTSGDTTDSLNKTPGGSDVPSIKQTALKRPQSRLAVAPGAPTPAPTASPVAATAPIAEDDESIDVWMPNKTLQALVAKQLKTSISKLTKDSLTGLTSLSVEHYTSGGKSTFIDGNSSFSLEGLQYATNLKSLDLGWNMYDNMFDGHAHGDITDVTPLKNLINLTTLDLQNNRITDVSALGGLKNLKSLNILGNGIADFSMLDSNQITDFQFGTQNVVWPTTYTIDPKSPQITIPQILKLPQNYQHSKGLVLDVPSDYSDDAVDDIVFFNHQTGLNTRRVYRRASDIALNEDGIKAPSTVDGSVTFIDIRDQEIPSHVGSGWQDTTVIQNPVTYYLIEDFVNKEIQINIFIPYVNPQPAANLTVHYVDMASNKPIQADKIITDKLTSDTYDLTTEETSVKGYTFDHADGALTGNFSADPLTVTLYFTKDPTKPVTPVTPPVVTPTAQTTVTAHYVDQNGKTVHADQVLTGHAGDSYSTTAFTIPGYDLTTTPENASGTFGDTDTTVTYVYTDSTSGNGVEVNIDPTYPVQPATPVNQEPTTGDQAATIHHPGSEATNQKGGAAVRVPATALTNQTPATPAKSVATTSASKTTLPQTSEHRITPLLGIALLLGTFLGFGLKRKQH